MFKIHISFFLRSCGYYYDNFGRIIKRDYQNDPDVTYSYDSRGRLVSMTDGVGTTVWSYDTLDRVISEDGPFDLFLIPMTL